MLPLAEPFHFLSGVNRLEGKSALFSFVVKAVVDDLCGVFGAVPCVC